MPNTEYTGASVSLPEIIAITIPNAVVGVRYGLEAYNIQPVFTLGQPGDSASSILSRLATELSARGFQVAGNRVTGLAGRATGLRVDSQAGSYIERVVEGYLATPKQVRVRMPLGTSGGTFTLTSTVPGGSGETTSGISGVGAASAVKSAIEALTTPQADDITVALEASGNATTRRSYLVTLGGSLAGQDVALTANGASLVGAARVNISTVQRAGDASKEVQVIWLPAWDPTQPYSLWLRLKSGATSSDWLYAIQAGSTTGLAPGTSLSWDVMIQRLVDNACGAGVWTAVWHYNPQFRGGALVLTATDAGAREQVSGVIRFTNNTLPSDYTASQQSNGLWILGDGSDTPGGTYGVDCQSETIRGHGTSQNEIVLLMAPRQEVSGSYISYDYSFDGNTAAISGNASESSLQTGWDTLAGSGNSEVFANPLTGSFAYPYLVMFKGTRANANQPAITIDDLTDYQVVIQQGTALLNQIDQIVIVADSGTFTLTYAGGSATSSLAYNLNAAALETALEGRTEVGSGNCTVTGSGTAADPFRAEYVSGKAATAMPALSANTSSLVGGADPEITQVTAAVPGRLAQAKLHIDPNANGGFLRLVGSGTSGEIQWDDDSAAIQTALDAHWGLTALGVTVTGESPVFSLDFDTVGRMPDLSISQESLEVTESSVLILSRLQEPAGPNCWDDPLNWSTRQIPSSGDTVILRDGQVTLDEGLTQRYTWVRSGTGLQLTASVVGARVNLRVGQKVLLSKGDGDTFPSLSSSSLSALTEYYIVTLDRWSGYCELSTTAGGTPVSLTNAGTGTFTIEVLLARLVLHSTQNGSDGSIGLPRIESGQRNERPLFLEIAATNVDLGVGPGNGSSRCNLDLGARKAIVRQDRSGSSAVSGEMATSLRLDQATSEVELLGGQLAVNPWDDADTAGSCGPVVNRSGTLLLGAVDIGSLDSLGGSVQSGDQYGFTCRGALLIRP